MSYLRFLFAIRFNQFAWRLWVWSEQGRTRAMERWLYGSEETGL